jgi:manganese/zinc/iron transport system substrate-binding protein
MTTFLFRLLVPVLALAHGAAAEPVVRAVATTGMVADLVRGVGGERVVVKQLMGPGVDPHLYKPSPDDTAQLAKTDVIFYNGLMLEGRMTGLFERLAQRGKPTCALAESIPPDQLLMNEGRPDPHVWMDAALWAATVPAVVETLVKADPSGENVYRTNGEKLAGQLRGLDAWCREQAATIPEGQRVLVTSHDAFNYFGRAYGFRVVALQGVSTVSETSLADMAGMTDLIRAEKIPAVFVETSVNPAGLRRIAEDTGARIGGELFSDALGDQGQMVHGFDAGTYEGMMRANMTTIVEALAPPPN